MTTQFEPLEFEEGVAITLTTTNGATFALVAIDIQDNGVMFDHMDGTTRKRMFRPWNTIASIAQTPTSP